MPETEVLLLRVVQVYLQRRLRAAAPGAIVTLYWDEFYQLYAPVVERMVRRTLRGADADDFLQEIWVLVAENLPRFQWQENRGGFRAWLSRLIHDKTVDLIRRRQRRAVQPLAALPHGGEPEDSSGDPARALDVRWRREIVRAALKQLRPQLGPVNFRIVVLHYWQALTVPQIAEQLGMRHAQVERRLHRALQKIRVRITAYLGEDLS